MTGEDKELLVLAARAASIYLDWDVPGDPLARDGDEWNPLEDDGDALRLAVELGFLVHVDRDNCWARVICQSLHDPIHAELFCDDSLAATRRAIVRAAAKIGQSA